MVAQGAEFQIPDGSRPILFHTDVANYWARGREPYDPNLNKVDENARIFQLPQVNPSFLQLTAGVDTIWMNLNSMFIHKLHGQICLNP